MAFAAYTQTIRCVMPTQSKCGGEAIVSVNFPNSNLDDPALARTAYG